MNKFWITLFIFSNIALLNASDFDNQFWGGYGIQHEFNDTYKLQSDGENRFRDNVSEHNLKKISMELVYSYSPWLDIGVKYQRGSIKNIEWNPEQKPVLRLKFMHEIGSWEFSNQHKFEYRIRKDNYNIRVYKNRTQISTDRYIKGKEFSFYLNEEIFYNATDDYMNLNRIRLGTQFYLYNILKPDIGFVFQSNNRHTYWDHLIGFTFKLWIVF